MNIITREIATTAAMLALALIISMPLAVSADDGFGFGGYDSGSDFGGYDSGFSSGGYDAGFDFGGYDSGFSSGGYDAGFDFGGYDSGFSSGGYDGGFDFGGYDSGFDFGGYDSGLGFGGYDSGFGFGGYDSGFDFGGYDSGFGFGGYDSGFGFGGYGDSGGYTEIEGYTETIKDTYIDEYGVKYSYSDSFAKSNPSYSTPGCTGCSTPPRTTPGCTSCGGSRSTPPIVVYNPSYPTPRPTPTPPPVITTPSSNTNVNTNTCVNNSCNSNVNNIDNSNNSINGSFNVAQVTPVSAYPVQYPVQYTFPPQQPVQNSYCAIAASPSSIQSGQTAYLSWTSYGATSAWLSDGIGTVAPSGTLAVRPNQSTTYTLSVSGFGGTRTCQTYVGVSGQYVALSQIPYTGFDLGTVGNAIYWMGLVSFAAAAAYLVLYYKGGASIFLPTILGTVRLPKLKRVSEMIAAPTMFSNSAVKAQAPRPVMAIKDFPAYADATASRPVVNNVSAPKDAMTVTPSRLGQGPRIVITRG